MNIFLKRLIIALLFTVWLTIPVFAQNLWNIYRENERVLLILETRSICDYRKFASYHNKLKMRLQLRQPPTLEPMFPGALSRREIAKRTGFQPKYDLRSFYIIGISPYEEKLKNYETPFGYAEMLRRLSSDWGELAMISVEPDLPLSAYSSGSTLSSSKCPDKTEAPRDLAWSLRNMRVPQAWQYSKSNGYPSEGIGEMIGHPDTGYTDHTDLDREALKISKDNNFIEKHKLPMDPLEPNYTGSKQPGHGTATGSVIISRGDVDTNIPENEEGGTTAPGKVTGVACKADLVPYRSIKSVIRFTYGNIEKAIYKAVNDGCSVISLSIGGTGHSALNAALAYAIGRNVIVVAAAGNLSWWPVVYPARYPFCIAVAATNVDDKPWTDSAHGKEVTVSAPGEAVWRALRSTQNENETKVEPSCGTSYSTANVAGVAALWLAHHNRNNLINQFNRDSKLQFVFKRLLQETAKSHQEWDDQEYGSGIVDAKKLLETNPDKVRHQAIEDFKKFIDEKRKSPESSLGEIMWMYKEISSTQR